MNGSNRYFQVPDDYPLTEKTGKIVGGKKFAFVKSVVWFSNLETPKRREKIELYKKYTPDEYPRYDNYNAINVDKVTEIPEDYYEEMGVPVTFLHKYNPDQFEIIDALNRYSLLDTQNTNEYVQSVHSHTCNINGVPTYFRIVIRRK